VNSKCVAIAGGGAAGFFAAITCAEADRSARVVVLEKAPHVLAKVRISGGGRCNVTHALFDPRAFAQRYPRGERALIGPLQRFQSSDTVEWFARRGVALKTEADGRMFPATDRSATIIDCLTRAALEAGVVVRTSCGVQSATRKSDGRFHLVLTTGEPFECDRFLLATGGCRTAALGEIPVSLGHSLVPPVPSLFTFHIEVPWLRALAGVAIEDAEVRCAGLCERGPLMITHWGLSGPVILRLSAWGARALSDAQYRAPLTVNWIPGSKPEKLQEHFQRRRQTDAAQRVINTPMSPLPRRLWEQLTACAGVAGDTRWSHLSRGTQHMLVQQLCRTSFDVTGKSLNKDEFVTCGGVPVAEVNFKTMESRVCPGLFFAGELLDIDGITGGFNFQAAWTTGWIAGNAIAQTLIDS